MARDAKRDGEAWALAFRTVTGRRCGTCAFLRANKDARDFYQGAMKVYESGAHRVTAKGLCDEMRARFGKDGWDVKPCTFIRHLQRRAEDKSSECASV